MLDTISLVPTTPIILALTMVAGVILLYAFSENTHIEQVSLGTLTLLLVFLHVVPLRGEDGAIVLGAGDILQGFASPALMTVLAFLVMGQGLMQTGSLDRIADKIFDLGVKYWLVLTAFILFAVTIMSGFLNNTPMVVIFIPIMQALAQRFHLSPSMVMMPLSFAAILGGMTTLIGSSTNILVSSTMGELGYGELDFFEFTIPGLLLAGVGFLYITFVAPYLLPNRADMAGTLFQEEKGKQFIAQITVPAKSKLIGESSRHGRFPSLKDVTVRMILRGEHSEVPPYDDFALEAGDVLVIATTGKMLADLVSSDDVIVGEGYLDSFSYGQTSLEEGEETGRILSEVMVVPASSMIGNTLELGV
ncbi:MAG: SLC13 family permease [Alphaproteobacteria bacterium GM7ARS4]|nr:SLC13 family permease [Alphaproteobacteria bacterium GM7ARS4]